MSHHHEHPLNRANSSSEQVEVKTEPLKLDSYPLHLSNDLDSSSLSLTQASRATGQSRSKIRRALDAGDFPNAFQNAEGYWKIPINNLMQAGFSVQIDGNSPVQSLTDDNTQTHEPAAIVDIRGVVDETVLSPSVDNSASKALEVVGAMNGAMHDLANRYAASEGRASVAETKLEFVAAQRDEARAEVERLRGELEKQQKEPRRRWFRR